MGGILNGQNDMIMKSLMKAIIGKKNIIATMNFQSMHFLVGLKIGVQVDESMPEMGIANRLFLTLIF